MTEESLGATLKEARAKSEMSLRAVEARTGINNAHLSQIENGVITKPEMAMLWELAALYDLKYADLLRLAGYRTPASTSRRSTQRMTVALRAMGEMSPQEQQDVLEYMATLRKRRSSE